MSWRHDPITDLDLMAYADGQLDAARRRTVAAHLATHPDDASMVETIIEQNAALRQSLSAIAEEPVPERLKAVLERDRRPLARPALQAAAVAGLALTSGLGGWWLGQDQVFSAAPPPAFLAALAPDLDAMEGAGRDGGGAVAAHAGTAVEMPAPWLADEVMLKLAAPSLGGVFTSPELQRLLDLDGRPTARFALDGPEGRQLSLYLQTRRDATPPAVRLVEAGASAGTAPAAYWQDGPLVWALTGEAEGGELKALAQRIAAAVELELSLGSIEAELTLETGDPVAIQVTSDDSQALPSTLSVPEHLPMLALPITLAGG